MTRPIHRDRRLMEITAAYEAHLARGFPITMSGQDETLQVGRDVDRTNWLTFLGICDEAVAAGLGDQNAPFPVRCTSNTLYTVTYAEGAALVRDLRLWAASAQANWWAMKDAASAADTAEALNAIDETQGWP